MVFLHEWDSAHKVARSCVLDSFIKSKAEPELELKFSQGASLFLAHLTAWLRMAYLFPQTAGGAVWYKAGGSHRYLTEFLEVRGVSIPLEISGLNHLKEEDKRESVKLLPLTTDTGVQDLAKFLASSNKAEGQEDTQVLLDSSGRDNRKHQNQVYLIAVLLCTSPQGQHGLCRCSGSCRWDMVGEVPCALDEPVLGVLRSLHLEVHRARCRSPDRDSYYPSRRKERCLQRARFRAGAHADPGSGSLLTPSPGGKRVPNATRLLKAHPETRHTKMDPVQTE
ncbi:armadillo-like helical domain containing protein 1 [Neopelma chrysocephalum]|uniref:armadillo-like helical domain containing protein 1 n=1 Tax=Neopelma chrysocephalum TaxID=114329 RepID=UPI000FCD2F32|nr:armadillo-like helical domain containing protein 1 [Neopelma chrysocephalum]